MTRVAPPTKGIRLNESEKAPTRLHRVVNWIGSLAILAACLWAYTFLGQRERPTRSKPPPPTATAVVTEAMTRHVGPVEIQANGVVVPSREIRLATEVAGRIVRQSDRLRAGRVVQRGEVLIELDPVEFQLELRRLEAQRAQESAQLNSIEVSVTNTNDLLKLAKDQTALAQGELERMKSLAQRNAASATESDTARRLALTAQTAVVELLNQLRELEAQRETLIQQQALTSVAVQRAQLDLDRTTIVSPIDGRVAACDVEEQSYVQAGTPFVTIEDNSAVEVRVNLTANQMKWVWSSQSNDGRRLSAKVRHGADSQSNAWEAEFERIDGAGIDTITRTYPCLFRVDQPTRSSSKTGPAELLRGMFVTVGMSIYPNRTLYQLPEAAIRPGNRVWLDGGGQLTIQTVEVISRLQNVVVVAFAVNDDAGDLEPDNEQLADVIVSPISDPAEGMAVRGNPS